MSQRRKLVTTGHFVDPKAVEKKMKKKVEVCGQVILFTIINANLQFLKIRSNFSCSFPFPRVPTWERDRDIGIATYTIAVHSVQDVRFLFTKNLNMLERPLNLTYTHAMSENRTLLNGTLELDSASKLSANYAFHSGNCKLKYSYAHGGTTLEPSYDFGNKSLDLEASQRILEGNLIRASYKTSSKTLGLEWSSNSKHNKNLRFKVSALLELAKGLHMPILNAESIWDFSL
ncbi:hypothetical protein I3842_01G035800 [Carya illinoinensis]|uniref:Uncharacterized protein n=1 Tax=Carya illinoinensis TaxID=32201 RepID=A0A922G1K4_CARIL|nr:hypothetical protein I3842_01G035800 [Carya illinoinensis]